MQQAFDQLNPKNEKREKNKKRRKECATGNSAIHDIPLLQEIFVQDVLDWQITDKLLHPKKNKKQANSVFLRQTTIFIVTKLCCQLSCLHLILIMHSVSEE